MKILIFFAPFGGGHLSAAKSLKESLEKSTTPDLEIKLIDFSLSSGNLRGSLINFYKLLAGKYTKLWALFYFLTQFKIVLFLANSLVTFFTLPWLVSEIKKENPDIIVTTYFVGGVLDKACKKLNLEIPVITLITDPFVFHPVWLQGLNQELVVFSEKALSQCLNYGYSKDKISLINPLIKPDFEIKIDKNKIADLKTKYNLVKSKVVLIIGGGEGLKDGDKILESLASADSDFEIVVVCGRSTQMELNCKKIQQKYFDKSITVFGFTQNVYELMNIADLIITKAGPGIVFEAIFLQKPMIINSYLWKQELGNKDYVMENGLGYYEPNLKNIKSVAPRLLNNPKLLNRIQNQYINLQFQSGNDQLIELILSKDKLAT